MTTNKGALSLITVYGDDSSDDEVPGCRVSTKRTHRDSDDDDENARKSARLPLPELMVKGLVYDKHNDNPILHEGRVRSFPHERGNWATYAYIPYDSVVQIDKITRGLIDVLPNVPLRSAGDFHVSLTRTVVLRHHWIESFVQSIKERISSIKRFLIIFNDLKVYCNEEKTRTFIGLEVLTGYDTLKKCVQILDQCLEEFRLAPFYKVLQDPSFHMSIAWCVGDHEQEMQSSLPLLNQKLHESVNSCDLSIFVQSISCKVGNKVFTFPLSL